MERRLPGPRWLTAAAVVLAAAALAATWYRLTLGCDLQDESFCILSPWRWSLGDRPFVEETDLASVAGLLSYPAVKLFAVLRDGDPAGLVLYTRHLYLLFVLGVAGIAVAFLRTLVRWQLALAAATVLVTYVFWETPNLTYDTLAAGLLVAGFMLGGWVVVHGRGRGYAAAAGAAHGLAACAYPTLLFVMPFVAVFLAFSLGRQAVGMIALRCWSRPPEPEPGAPPTGPAAWRALSAYAVGGVVPPLLLAVVVAGIGVRHALRSWEYSLQNARELGQLAGAGKAVDVAVDAAAFLLSQWALVLLLAAAVALVTSGHRRSGRLLLLTLPPLLYLAGTRSGLDAAGFILAAALTPPALFACVPRRRRWAGARLLIWIWAPSMVAGAMTAYTSADGYAHAVVGLYPATILAALFLAWALEAAFDREEEEAPAGDGRGLAVAFAGLAAVVAVTVVFQFQYQAGGVPYGELTVRPGTGPWAGVAMPPGRARFLRQVAGDLAAHARPGDGLLIYYEGSGLYLLWSGRIVGNTVRIYSRPTGSPLAPLPEQTVQYMRRARRVPDVVIHLCETDGASPRQLAGCGGLAYPVVAIRPGYTMHRRPPGDGLQQVLDRLPHY